MTVYLIGDHAIRIGAGARADDLEILLRDARGVSLACLGALVGRPSAEVLVEAALRLRLVNTFPVQEVSGPAYLQHTLKYLQGVTPDPVGASARLSSAVVAIIGVGGVGSLVLQHLVGSGVQHFILVDGDRVEWANLNRQMLFRPSMVGLWKVDVASAYVKEFSANVRVSSSRTFVRSVEQLRAVLNLDGAVPDVVVCAADKPPGEMEKWCRQVADEVGAMSIECGVGINRGYWGPLRGGALAASRTSDAPEVEGVSGEPLGISFSPVNAIVAAGVAAHVFWGLIGYEGAAKLSERTYFDLVEGIAEVGADRSGQSVRGA